MKMVSALKIAFLPRTGTAIYLGLIAAMALVRTAVIERQPLLKVISFTLGCLFLALAVKLYAQVFYPIFLGRTNNALPRGSMFLLAMILHISALLLSLPMLLEYAEMSGIEMK